MIDADANADADADGDAKCRWGCRCQMSMSMWTGMSMSMSMSMSILSILMSQMYVNVDDVYCVVEGGGRSLCGCALLCCVGLFYAVCSGDCKKAPLHAVHTEGHGVLIMGKGVSQIFPKLAG